MWSGIEMDIASRVMAFCTIAVFFGATAVGSILPEFGNIMAKRLNLEPHFFNPFFLAMGIAGIGLALYLGFKSGG